MSYFTKRWTPLTIGRIVMGGLILALGLYLRVTTLPHPWDITHPLTFWVWISDMAGLFGLGLLLVRLSRFPLLMSDYSLKHLLLRMLGAFLLAGAAIIRGVFIPMLIRENLLHDQLLWNVLQSDCLILGGFLLVFGWRQSRSFLRKAFHALGEIKKELAAIGRSFDHLITSLITNNK